MDYQPQEYQNINRYAGLSSACVVLGIIGCILSPLPLFGTVLPALALTLALLTKGKDYKVTGSARTGMILGIVGLAISLIVTVATIVLVTVSMVGSDEWDQYENQLEYQLEQPSEL